MKLGLLGGTFNPLHSAHLRLAEEMREALGLERVLFVVAGDPPLKRGGVAEAKHRLAMVELAIGANPAFEVSDLELRRAGPSYTIDTLRELRARQPGASLWFLCGADALRELESWREPAQLFELASFGVATRPGEPHQLRTLLPASLAGPFREGAHGLVHSSGNELRTIALTPLAISASDVRSRLANGRSVRYLVPDEVIAYIEKHRLYRVEASEDE